MSTKLNAVDHAIIVNAIMQNIFLLMKKANTTYVNRRQRQLSGIDILTVATHVETIDPGIRQKIQQVLQIYAEANKGKVPRKPVIVNQITELLESCDNLQEMVDKLQNLKGSLKSKDTGKVRIIDYAIQIILTGASNIYDTNNNFYLYADTLKSEHTDKKGSKGKFWDAVKRVIKRDVGGGARFGAMGILLGKWDIVISTAVVDSCDQIVKECNEKV